MQVDFFIGKEFCDGVATDAKTRHHTNAAVMRIEQGATSITFFGPARAKDAFDQIAALFNEVCREPEAPAVAEPSEEIGF